MTICYSTWKTCWDVYSVQSLQIVHHVELFFPKMSQMCVGQSALDHFLRKAKMCHSHLVKTLNVSLKLSAWISILGLTTHNVLLVTPTQWAAQYNYLSTRPMSSYPYYCWQTMEPTRRSLAMKCGFGGDLIKLCNFYKLWCFHDKHSWFGWKSGIAHKIHWCIEISIRSDGIMTNDTMMQAPAPTLDEDQAAALQQEIDDYNKMKADFQMYNLVLSLVGLLSVWATTSRVWTYTAYQLQSHYRCFWINYTNLLYHTPLLDCLDFFQFIKGGFHSRQSSHPSKMIQVQTYVCNL